MRKPVYLRILPVFLAGNPQVLFGCVQGASNLLGIPRGFPIPNPGNPVEDMQLCEDFQGDSIVGLTSVVNAAQPLESHVVRFDQETARKVEVVWTGAIRESFGEIQADGRVLLVEGAGESDPFPPS